MKRYRAGESVHGHYYWNLKRWEACHVPPPGGKLPGQEGDTFIELSLPFILVGAPLLGLAYVIFLPFIGLALVLSVVAQRLAKVAGRLVGSLAATASVGLQPGEAYLTGKRQVTEQAPGEARKSDTLEQLAREISEKRRNSGK